MPRTDAVWSAEGTTPDAIEAALRELLIEAHAEREEVFPARVLNMIAFVDLDWTGEIANRLRGVGRYHASRLVVLAYEPRRERLDARVTVSTDDPAMPGELALLRETVVVELGDRHLDDLRTIADPLVVTDLPTLLWSPHGHHEIIDELLPLAQAVLIDSVEEPDYGEALARAATLSDRAYVVDLAWLRSTPWRERVAALFDPPWLRPELALALRGHGSPPSPLDGRGGAARGLAGLAPAVAELASRRSSGRADRQGPREPPGRHACACRARPSCRCPGSRASRSRRRPGTACAWTAAPAGCARASRARARSDREWTVPGASRGETGVLGEGIRQALLRDPTYLPALGDARTLLA